jgi:hypothetical protein
VIRERAVLHDKLSLRRSHVPLPDLIVELNRHLRGRAAYYCLGHSRKAMRDVWGSTQAAKSTRLKGSPQPLLCLHGTGYTVNVADNATLARAVRGKSGRPI